MIDTGRHFSVSLSKKEKIEFILVQLRLTLAKKDFVRAHIVGNKVNRKALGEEGMESYRIRFFELMAEYHRHEKDAYELIKDYHAIYSTHVRMMANSGVNDGGKEESKMESDDDIEPCTGFSDQEVNLLSQKLKKIQDNLEKEGNIRTVKYSKELFLHV